MSFVIVSFGPLLLGAMSFGVMSFGILSVYWSGSIYHSTYIQREKINNGLNKILYCGDQKSSCSVINLQESLHM